MLLKDGQERTSIDFSSCGHDPIGLRGPIGRIGVLTPAASEAEFLGRAINYLTLACQDLHGDKEVLEYAYIDMESMCEEILAEYRLFLEKTKRGMIDKNNRYFYSEERGENYSFSLDENS